jgi:predicted RNA-binding Zn-ribbon protein involved in translation (DUF1610 family)
MPMYRKPHLSHRVFASRRMLPIALSVLILGLPTGLRAGEPEQHPQVAQTAPNPVVPSVPATITIAPVSGQVAPPAAPAAPSAPQGRFSTIYFAADDETLQTKVALDAKDMPVVEALKQVLDQAKVKYDIDSDVPTDKKITMTLKNVPLSAVLGILTREAGVGWHYSRKLKADKAKEVEKSGRAAKFDAADFETTIRISKKGASNVIALMPGGAVRVESTQRAVEEAMARARSATTMPDSLLYNAYTPARMPDKLVKVDSRNANLRDVLKDVLKQAGLDYALEDDVPEDVKRSFTFENIPISMALDVICRSAEIGWRAERSGTGKEIKTVVRIGKKYVRRGGTVNSFGGFGANFPYTPTPIVTVPGEQRVAFTCPHCKSKVRVVRDSKDEMQKAWKFCPVCGKAVDVQSFFGNVPAHFDSGMEERHLNILLDMQEMERPLFGIQNDLQGLGILSEFEGFSGFESLEPFTAFPSFEILEERFEPVFPFDLDLEQSEAPLS